MSNFDVDSLLIKVIKHKSEITLADLVDILRDALSQFTSDVEGYITSLNILDQIELLDDDVKAVHIKPVVSRLNQELRHFHIRSSTIIVVNSLKQYVKESMEIPHGQEKYVDDIFDMLIEMQKLYNLIRNFHRVFNVVNLKEEINQVAMQSRMAQVAQERVIRRIEILKEIEDIQINLIDLKRQRESFWNLITGKRKTIDLKITLLEERLSILKR